MALDLTRIAAQVGDMLSRLKAAGEQRQEHLQQAINVLNQLDNPKVKAILRRVLTKVFNDTPELICCHEYKAGNVNRRQNRRENVE